MISEESLVSAILHICVQGAIQHLIPVRRRQEQAPVRAETQLNRIIA